MRLQQMSYRRILQRLASPLLPDHWTRKEDALLETVEREMGRLLAISKPTHVVLYVNRDGKGPEYRKGCAVLVGPGCTYKSVEALYGLPLYGDGKWEAFGFCVCEGVRIANPTGYEVYSLAAFSDATPQPPPPPEPKRVTVDCRMSCNDGVTADGRCPEAKCPYNRFGTRYGNFTLEPGKEGG